MLEYISTYMALFVMLACLIYPYSKVSMYHQDSIKWAFLIIFVLFFGLHGNIGDDYEVYQKFYNDLTLSKLTEVLEYEPGFTAFALCFKKLNLPFWCFVLACSCLINGLLFRFLWKSEHNIPFVLCIFVSIGGVMNEMNFLRSTISMMLFVNSIEYLQRKNIRMYLLMNTIGMLFHYSSLLYILFFFCCEKVVPKKYVMTLIVAGGFMSLFHIPFLAPVSSFLSLFNSEVLTDLSSYYLSTDMLLTFSVGTVERMMTAMAIWCFYKELTEKSLGKIAVNSFLVYFFCYSFLSAYAMLSIRLANMFVFCYWLIWPMILKCIKNNKAQIGLATLMLSYMIVRVAGIARLPQWQYTTIFYNE